MKKVCAVVMAVAWLLAGCGSGPHGEVTGRFVRSGGPAPGSPVPLPGTITARSARGDDITVDVGANGRFRLSLPPGTYHLTGRSPLVAGVCRATGTVVLTADKSVSGADVVCTIA